MAGEAETIWVATNATSAPVRAALPAAPPRAELRYGRGGIEGREIVVPARSGMVLRVG